MKYVGYVVVYVYFNKIKNERVTWDQIKEEKDSYGIPKYGILAGFLGFIFIMGLIIILVKLTW